MVLLNQKPQVIKVDKPWGTFERHAHNAACTVKIISVVLGSALSRWSHHHRDELYPSAGVEEDARVELGEKILHPKPGEKLSGEKLFIPKGMIHRLSCVGEDASRNLEISFGEFDEQDIARVEEAYGCE